MCRGVSEGEIVEAVRMGARTLEEVSRRCEGAGFDCGSCQPWIEDHITGRCDDRAA